NRAHGLNRPVSNKAIKLKTKPLSSFLLTDHFSHARKRRNGVKRLAIALFLASVGTSANASDYGCTVLLCLSNPAGPKAVSECVPPIDRLFRDLRKGRSFPSCDMATGPGGRSYARQVYDPYDPCPAPLKPAPRGSVVAQGAPNPDARPRGFRNGSHMYQLTARPQVSEPRDNE